MVGGALPVRAFARLNSGTGTYSYHNLSRSAIAKIPAVVRELHRQSFRHLIAIGYEKNGPVDEDTGKDVEFARQLA